MLTPIFSCTLTFFMEDNKKLYICHWELCLHGCPSRRKADVDFVIMSIVTHSHSRTDPMCINRAAGGLKL